MTRRQQRDGYKRVTGKDERDGEDVEKRKRKRKRKRKSEEEKRMGRKKSL